MQDSNCHPFRHGRWLFVHNGYGADFHLLRRDLMLAIDPEHEPIEALQRTVGLVETAAGHSGFAALVQGTFGISDGASLWAARYATDGTPRSLFASADVERLKALHAMQAAAPAPQRRARYGAWRFSRSMTIDTAPADVKPARPRAKQKPAQRGDGPLDGSVALRLGMSNTRRAAS